MRTVTLLGQPEPTRPVLILEPESSSSTVKILGYYTIPPSVVPTAAGSVNAASSTSSKSHSNTPIIVGATIGGVVALALVAFLAWFFRRRARNRYSASRGTTPMLGDHGGEKSGMDETTDTRSLRGSGGIFSPFGGELRTAAFTLTYLHISGYEPVGGARHSMEIEEGGTLDNRPAANEEKKALVPPPDNEHPAYHPLPGKNLPAYVPGQPAYNTLPSQRSVAPRSKSLVPDVSPKIPGLIFTPIEIVLGDTHLDTIPITPKAELAASPVHHLPKPSSPIPSSKFSTARTSLTPSSPRKSLTSLHPAPLAKVATSRSPRDNGPLTNFSMKHISSPRPGFPSPTAGGKIELPASWPPTDASVAINVPVKAPLNPTPAFHHIYLPEPLSGISRSSADTAYSTIPIGLGDTTPDIKTRAINSRDDWMQPKPSNLRQEHIPSPQIKHGSKLSQPTSRDLGSPPQPGQGKRRTPPTAREPRASPPPKLHRENTPPLPLNGPLSLSETHPAFRDHVRQGRVETPTPKQRKQSRRKSPPPLRQQPSDVSVMSDSYYPLHEKSSEQSMLTVSEGGDFAPIPVKSKHKKKWSASERDGMSLLVYKGDAPLGTNEVTPLFNTSHQAAQLSEESDMSIQPLVLQSRQGWSPVPLTPMTPLNKSKARKLADGAF